MRLYRILLENYRGVRRSQVVFDPTGVTVVHGPNEIGKSSLIEALDLMLRFPATTSHRDVQAVRPKGRAEDPFTEIEVGAGDYRLLYRKIWRKTNGKTELHILEPAAKQDQLENHEAQAKFEELLAECDVDLELWKLLRVSQDKPLGRESKEEPLGQPTTFAVRPAVAAALGTGARRPSDGGAEDGVSTAFSGPQERLFMAVDREYLLYYTPKTGEPTGKYSQVMKELAEANEKAGEAKQALVDAQGILAEYGRVNSELKAIEEELNALRGDIDGREQLLAEAKLLEQQLRQLKTRLEVATLVADAANELAQRSAELDDEQTRYEDAKQKYTTAEDAHQQKREAADRLEAVSSLFADALALAEKDVECLRSKELLARLEDAVAVAEAAQTRIEAADTKLARNSLDKDALTAISDAFSAWDKALSALEANAATVRVERLSDAAVTVNGPGAAEGSEAIRLLDTVTVEAPGIVRVVVAPGSGEQARREKERKTRAAYEKACREAGVPDVSAAQAMADEHDAAVAQRGIALAELNASLSGVKSHGKDLAAIRQLAVSLRAMIAAYMERRPATTDTLPKSIEIAQERQTEAQVAAAEHETRLKTATNDANATDKALALSRERLRALERSLPQLDQAVKRAQANMERLPALESPEHLEQARSEHEQAEARLAELNLDQLASVQENKRKVQFQLQEDATTLRLRSAELRVLIAECGERGPEEAAERARDHAAQAQHEFDVLWERAEAAKLLRETLTRHRSEQRTRYATPFRELVEKYAAAVFGSAVNLHVGEDLTIASKTIGGVTVPFNSLSTGTREQLALLGRIACAQLVAPGAGGVPLILDDTLGHSDRQRIDQIAAILDRVSGTGTQVIILTHAPKRFRIGSATRVDLALA